MTPERRFQLSMAFIVVIYSMALECLGLATSMSVLNLICVDDGLADDCNDAPQVRALSSFTIITTLATTIPMLLSYGVLSALADRWGRKRVLLLSLAATILDHIIWILIFLSDRAVFGSFFRDNWRILIPIGAASSGLGGSFFLIFFCLYAIAADHTQAHPEIRSSTFILLEGCAAVGAVLGLQLTGYLIAASPSAPFMLGLASTLAVILVVLVGVVDETPAEARQRKLKWKDASFIGAIAGLCMGRGRGHHNHAHAHGDSNAGVLDSQITANTLDAPLLTGAEADSALTGDARGDRTSRRSTAVDGNLTSDSEPCSDCSDDDGGDAVNTFLEHLPPVTATIPSAQAFVPVSVGEAHDGTSTNTEAEDAATLHSAQNENPARAGNGLLVLGASAALGICGAVGSKMVFVPFLSQEHDMSNVALSNLATVEAAARACGSFFLAPLLQRLAPSRVGELRTMQIFFVVMGMLLAVIPAFSVTWAIFLALPAAASASAVPLAFLRGLVSTEVSPAQQGKALGAITAVEITVSAISAPSFSALFSLTNETFAGVSYIAAGGFLALAAVVPVFLSDSKVVFNSKRRRVTEDNNDAAEGDEESKLGSGLYGCEAIANNDIGNSGGIN